MSLQTKTRVPPFSAEHTEAICRILGETADGLPGSEIGRILADMGVDDPTPDSKKWKRLFNALAAFQNQHMLGNAVIVFVSRAMNPEKYADRPLDYEDLRLALNQILALNGFSLRGDGKIVRCDPTAVLDEAMIRANQFQSQLMTRGVHNEVFQYSTPEILSRGYFNAVFQAMKSISAKVRKLSGLEGEGAELMERAFSLGKTGQPLVAINSLDSEAQKGEHRGFVSLLVGLYGTARNPLSHNVKTDWNMTEQDALDVMSVVSIVHRKLEAAAKIQPIGRSGGNPGF